jgi:hypothetical protein
VGMRDMRDGNFILWCCLWLVACCVCFARVRCWLRWRLLLLSVFNLLIKLFCYSPYYVILFKI